MRNCCLFIFVIGFAFPLWSQPSSVYATLEENYNQNAFEACIAMEKQVQAFADNRLDTLVANSFFYLGDAYNQLGEIEKALAWFEKEKTARYALQLGQTEDYSNSLNNLAYLYLTHGDYALAGKAADELLAVDRKLYDARDIRFITSVLYVADIYLQLDRIREAERLLVSTLRAQDRQSHNSGVLSNKLGDLYTYSGEFSRAQRALMMAVDIHADEGGEESAAYLNAAINLGILYMNQGKYPEAEEIFEVALSKLDRAEIAYAAVHNNQALVFQSLGQLDRAEKAFGEILVADSLTVGTFHPDYAITLSNLGLVYADQGKFEQAERSLKRALDIQQRSDGKNTLSYGRKLNNLAKVYQMSGSPEKAVPLLVQALAIFKRTMGKNSAEYATGSYNLGLAYWGSGNAERGYKYLKASAAIRAKVLGPHHPRYAESLLKIGEYQWQKKSLKDARRSFGDVFQNYYFQIDETFPVLTEEEKSKFYYTKIRDAFSKFNAFATTHYQVEPALLGDAYNYTINTKAAIMFATEKVRTSILTSGDTALIRQFDEWQAAREQIANRYTLNQGSPELDSLLANANALEKSLARRSSTFENQFVRTSHTWEDIRSVLKDGEAAVEVLRFKNYSPEGGGNFSEEIRYAFLIVTAKSGAHPELVLLNDGAALETKFLRYYRNNIKYKVNDVYSYQYYFQALAEHLKSAGIHRIYFSPDGVYNQINLNSIEIPGAHRFLIDEFDIRIVTNTRELLAQNDSTSGGIRDAVLFGFPKFNLEEAERGHGDKKPTITRGGSVERTWRGGLLRYMRGEGGITMLPGTRVEVEKIAGLSPGNARVYMAAEATERAVKSTKSPQVLHIATHGYFLEDNTVPKGRPAAYIPNPLLNAGLILAGAENFLTTGEPVNADGDDGVLTAFEAMNLNLEETDLVVLSACETALGDVRNGEGVYGLQRAFKLAGARNIVMSLWNVDDTATQELMTSFYQYMLKTGDPHQAFSAAQQQVRKKYPEPFYWGAFVMIGI